MTSDAILVINSGSSSIRFAVFALQSNKDSIHLLYRGKIAGIGCESEFSVTARSGEIFDIAEQFLIETKTIHDHAQAFSIIFDWMSQHENEFTWLAAGHRIVHGGDKYSSPVMIDKEILADLKSFIPLAPLHQPSQIAGIETLAQLQSDLPQIACFDTAFHRNQPFVAQQFALPRALQQQGILRYGFHGLSYEYIASVLPQTLNGSADDRVIVAHLGNGASMCAMKSYRSIATTMSFSPMDGLPMGTRCGALDPAVVLYLMQEKGMDVDAVSDLLNYKSGLLGVSGISSDMRELLDNDNVQAVEAVDLFVYRAGRELGSLAAALGGLDALVFTAGIGEHAPVIRERICRAGAWLGISIDEAANVAGKKRISTTNSPVSVWVIPTDEEQLIANHTKNLIGSIVFAK